MQGMRKIKRTVDAHNAQNNRTYTRRLKLEADEFAQVLFLGTAETEPYISQEHSYRESEKIFSSEVCAEEDCVLCHANAEGDKRVGRAAPKACFNLYDLRWQKKTLDRKRSEKDGKERFKYESIAEDDVTDSGVRKGIFLRAGHVAVEYPPMHVSSLDAVNRQAGKRCKNCGGKITVAGYKTKDGTIVTKKAKAMDPDELDERLEQGKILEVIACSKCEDPERVSIFNSVVQIGRSGQGKSTTYQFQILPQEEIPDDVTEALEKIKLFDWEELKKPKPPNALATMLGKRNPYKGKQEEEDDMMEDYDEDEADESEVFDEDDEDEAPRRATKKKRPSRR